MLVKFAVEPDALSETTDGSVFDNMYQNFWIPYGICVDSAFDQSIRMTKGHFADEIANAFKSYEANGWPIWVTIDDIHIVYVMVT